MMLKSIFLNNSIKRKLCQSLFTFKSQLRNEKINTYYLHKSNCGDLPDPQWIYYLSYKSFKKLFGHLHLLKKQSRNIT